MVNSLVLAGLKEYHLFAKDNIIENKANKDAAEVYFHKASFLFVVAYFINIQNLFCLRLKHKAEVFFFNSYFMIMCCWVLPQVELFKVSEFFVLLLIKK